MANKDNQCKDLVIENLYPESQNTLNDLFMLQKDIQEKVYGHDFDSLRNQPLSVMKDFFLWNTHAQVDEAHEAMDALGGMHDGIGNAVWKPCKKVFSKTLYNDEFTYETFNSLLSERDKVELKMELIDELHFLFNKMHAVGMTTGELYNFYFSKNKENRDRQRRGY